MHKIHTQQKTLRLFHLLMLRMNPISPITSWHLLTCFYNSHNQSASLSSIPTSSSLIQPAIENPEAFSSLNAPNEPDLSDHQLASLNVLLQQPQSKHITFLDPDLTEHDSTWFGYDNSSLDNEGIYQQV